MKLSLLVLTAVACPAAPVTSTLSLTAGEYSTFVEPSFSSGRLSHWLTFDGPEGVKLFGLPFSDGFLAYMVLGDRGIAAFTGSNTADEVVYVLDYRATPDLVAPLTPMRIIWPPGLPYPPGYKSDTVWLPIPFIQDGRLYLHMRGEAVIGPFDPPFIFFDYDTGILTGNETPEPPPWPLCLAAGLLLARRRKSPPRPGLLPGPRLGS